MTGNLHRQRLANVNRGLLLLSFFIDEIYDEKKEEANHSEAQLMAVLFNRDHQFVLRYNTLQMVAYSSEDNVP